MPTPGSTGAVAQDEIRPPHHDAMEGPDPLVCATRWRVNPHTGHDDTARLDQGTSATDTALLTEIT
jgi:hypothetical protein